MRAVVDAEECIGTGMCVVVAPELFDLSPDDRAVVLAHPSSPAAIEALDSAVACCPVAAISIQD